MKTATYSVSDFTPLARTGGYLPIEDFGLIGDGSSAALVGRDGTVAWLCVARFDDAEESWGIVEPIVEAWAAGAAPLGTYRSGSGGPTATPT